MRKCLEQDMQAYFKENRCRRWKKIGCRRRSTQLAPNVLCKIGVIRNHLWRKYHYRYYSTRKCRGGFRVLYNKQDNSSLHQETERI